MSQKTKTAQYEPRNASTSSVGGWHFPFYFALLDHQKVYRLDKLNKVSETLTINHPGIQGNAANITYYGYKDLRLTRPKKMKEKDKLVTVTAVNADGPTPSRYKWEWKGVTFDFYRLCEILGIKHHAQAHALKKIIRAGKSIKSVEQDIDETIAALLRWKEMIKEDQKNNRV